MRACLYVASLWLLFGCAAQRPALKRSVPSTPWSDDVVVRVTGTPDVELVSPDGKRIRASNGGVLQNDFPGQGHAYSVMPNTQIGIENPLPGIWELHVHASEDRELLWVMVSRSLNHGRRGCDAFDKMPVKQNELHSWNLRWSPPSERDTCWIQISRTK